MGATYPNPGPLAAREFSVTAAQLAASGGAAIDLGPLPPGYWFDVSAHKMPQLDAGTVNLNVTGSGSGFAATADIAPTTAGVVTLTAWKSAIPALVLASQQYLYAILASGTPTTGKLVFTISYRPSDFGY